MKNEYLADFTSSIENHGKVCANKIRASQKNIYESHWEKCKQKRKFKKRKNCSFCLCMDFICIICTKMLAHPLANKSSWMKVVDTIEQN